MSSRGSSPFHIRSVAADPETGEIELHYGFAGGPHFCERISLPPAQHPLDRNTRQSFETAARLLLLVAGTSYYKSQAPDTVVVEVPTTAAERVLVESLYDHGLREFAYINDLAIPLVTAFDWAGDPAPDRPPHMEETDIGRPLVPFGGGKDSTVVLGLLPEATAMTVNPTSTHTDVAAVLGHELLTVRRRIDQLDELTRPDRLNGHIPITAIVSSIAIALAVRDGYTSVVLANEKAASEPTLVSDAPASAGRTVNHQWSKGATFEALFDRALVANGLPVRYFSWLRRIGEPEIIALLSQQDTALNSIVSCNRAFAGRTAGGEVEAPQRWCGDCPKCLFTYLMLATQLSPDRLTAMFGSDLLDRPDRADGFAKLWAAEKPLECVGERVDAAGALVTLANRPEWAEHTVVVDLVEGARAALIDGEWDSTVSDDELIDPRPAPPAFVDRMTTALGR